MTAQVTSTGPQRTMDTALPVPRTDTAEESSGSGAEGRVRRKFQRTTSQNDNGLRKQSGSISMSNARTPADSKSSFAAARRRSVREHKAPLGPRPLDHSSSKRVTSDASAASNNPLTTRSFLPTSTSEPFFNNSTSTRANNPRFSFGKSSDVSKEHPDSNGSYDFLPSVSFDDFHESISSYEPALSDFPAPGGGGGILANTTTSNRPTMVTGNNARAEASDSRVTRSTSLLRRLSTANRPLNQPPTASASLTTMPPPNTPLSVRTRRQSQFPTPTTTNPAARPPRRSVGPGLITTATETRDGRQESSKQPLDNSQSSLGRTASIGKANHRGTLTAGLSAGSEASRLTSTTRNVKAKSLQPPSRQTPVHLTTPSMTPDHGHASSLAHGRSPGRSPGQRNGGHTPSSSSSKRQSTMHHVGGLGARTISPTDARRLKRLSMLPNPPGIPQTPPTPQPDYISDIRALSHSPAMVFRKSVTPSSARATPDQINKTYGSGLSLSSNSSFNSLRASNGNGSFQSRASQNLSTSRLPTPKPRNVHSSAGGEPEEVPPVPAIPKAYESPKDPEHSNFSSLRPQTIACGDESYVPSTIEDTIPHEPHTFEAVGTEPTFGEVRTGRGTIRHRRGLTVGSGSDPDKAPAMQIASKKNLQPIRLPPLNLLPLGTPFNSKIASFPVPSAEVDHRHATPPPKRSGTKTPSTPMTASKATFFSKSHHGDEQYSFNSHLRSSSSAFNLRSEPITLHQSYGSSTMPIPISTNGGRQITTPFASASLPKSSGDFSHIISRPSGEYKLSDTDTEMQNAHLSGPRLLTKKDSSSAHTSTSTEPETPSSGSSLRRKLSLGGWRRSSSKASHASHASQSHIPVQKGDDQPPQPPRHNDMPPPRLPASATWSGPIGTSPSPSHRARPSLEFRQRKPSTSTVMSDNEVEVPHYQRQHAHKVSESSSLQAPPAYSAQSAPAPAPTPKSSLSILTPMHRMMGSKGSLNALKARHLDSNLDKDDLAADEEMKKLASKRKDFEAAARDVDDLRKRAKPQERVSPTQALQMVNLNIFERGEIIDYKEIYFCGTKNARKHVGDLNAQTANFGYDDDRGDYNIVFGDHLSYRYEVVDLLGKGSFGQVVRCVDHKTGQLVAVKIIRNKKRFHQQALVEVNILQKLREWDPENKHSMINFTQSFYFRGHLCISTELLGMNLYEFIKAHEFKGFSLRLIRRFCKQMLSSLVLLKSHRVIHCDLKPENILLAHPLHSEIKVIDFGSSCFENEKVYTYIQSRFYRSPEVILGMSYGMPIDMWSLGCILAELLTGYPIFPGENEQEQLACIMEIFGPPEKHLIEKSSRKKLFFDSLGKPRVTVSSKGRRRRPSSKTLQQALKCDDEAFLDFITRCLRWDPDKRMKPDEAGLHEFVTGAKRPARPRPHINSNASLASPVKRYNTVQTPQRTRPLPEPPATSFKNGTAVTNRDISSSSPVKGAPRRHSTVQGLQASTGVKRSANGAPLNSTSSLPRVTQRSVSGKPDLASAAAIASLRSR
ncbi:hypothetical protein K432DRAFT_424057 [Lepidopterella palustris CBS 459.81]|uniref:dual-specificity kinase n=1 Tax=Lepidopterella palustris CBS 459.81 TaxID=1314670 RepID=A0A8E2EF00_9PEZI|nr:hypothetical protein K432DRAFT_424057 [Lepidopterella palustris CBS 459.81]